MTIHLMQPVLQAPAPTVAEAPPAGPDLKVGLLSWVDMVVAGVVDGTDQHDQATGGTLGNYVAGPGAGLFTANPHPNLQSVTFNTNNVEFQRTGMSLNLPRPWTFAYWVLDPTADREFHHTWSGATISVLHSNDPLTGGSRVKINLGGSEQQILTNDGTDLWNLWTLRAEIGQPLELTRNANLATYTNASTFDFTENIESQIIGTNTAGARRLKGGTCCHAIWTRLLTNEEIEFNYNSGNGRNYADL